MPTLLPYPDALDVVLVQDEVTAAVNEARTEHGRAPLAWDETLQELAEWQAWQIVKGNIYFDEIDDWLATQLGEPVVELRACMSDNVTTPDHVARDAVVHNLARDDLGPLDVDRPWIRLGLSNETESGPAVTLAGTSELRGH